MSSAGWLILLLLGLVLYLLLTGKLAGVISSITGKKVA